MYSKIYYSEVVKFTPEIVKVAKNVKHCKVPATVKMGPKQWLLLCTSCSILLHIETKRILAVFPLNEKSHNNVLDALAIGLAKRGHQIDVITHFELKNPPANYKTIINLNGTRENFVNNLTIEFCTTQTGDSVPFYAFTAGNEICDLMSLESIQKLIKNPPIEPAYDLVITEVFGANCYMGLGYVFKVPVITVATNLGLSWTGDGVGCPTATAIFADVLTDNYEISSFWDRLKNTMISQISKYRFFSYTEEAQTEAMRKFLSPTIPRIREIEKTVALTLVNSYHNPFGIRPLTPGMIEIGGLHIEENNEKLSPDLEQWMHESTHGVIYFSLGSMVLIETLPENSLLAIYQVFSKLSPMRVLIKIIDKEKLPSGLPENIRISSWIPQIPILKHKNTKLFITHGGMLGIQEALYYKVPMIGIPLYGDQFRNIATLTSKNVAVQINYRNITKQSLTEGLGIILNSTKYREAIVYESQLFRDRPMKPMDTAAFWVEYVMRNGATTLRSPSVNLNWWQAELLDVYGFIILCCTASTCSLIFILKLIIQMIFRTARNAKENDKKYKAKKSA